MTSSSSFLCFGLGLLILFTACTPSSVGTKSRAGGGGCGGADGEHPQVG